MLLFRHEEHAQAGMAARQQDHWVWNSGGKSATDVYLRVASPEMIFKPRDLWSLPRKQSQQIEKGTDLRTG